MPGEIILSMNSIVKRYPGVLANDSVHFNLREGEIHGLLGENGAGKSTLMNILYGMQQPDEGEIVIHGVPVVIDSPKKALDNGIGMVHQHFMLVKPFTVAVNIAIGMKDRFGWKFDDRIARRHVEDFYKKVSYFQVDPDAVVEDLPVGIRQRVEIIKILFRGAKILIMDEPTAVLTPQEAEELFSILRLAAADGYSVIFISHKLDEIMSLTDRVTVMRAGKVIGEVETAETDKKELARMMVGRDVVFRIEKNEVERGAKVLEVENLTVEGEHVTAVKGVFLSVHAGEILGVAGVDGNGQKEMVEAIVGLRKKTSGKVSLFGKDITNITPTDFVRHCSYIPEDRHEVGLILDFSVAYNLILETHVESPFSHNAILNPEAIKSNALRQIDDFGIKTPGPDVKVSSLSGGNQQKVVVSRELSKNPDLLIAVNPTRGIDVGSIEEIQRKILAARDAGKAVLLISTELDEVISLSDRIAVMYEGEFMGVVRPDTPKEEIGLMMAGTLAEELLQKTEGLLS